MVRRLVTLVFVFSCMCFALTFGLHTATFFATNLGGVRRFFLFHFIAMGIAVFTILMLKTRGERLDPRALPSWSRTPLVLLLSYFVLNMISLYIVLKGGSPVIVNGSYQLTDHGRRIRFLTKDEYQSFTNWELRFFASGWMIFFASVAAYLWHLREVLKPGSRELNLAG